MLDSLVVIIFGLGFGGLLEKLGVLKVIVSTFEKKLTSAGNVTLSTLIVAFLANIFGCAMYVSLILTPKIMETAMIACIWTEECYHVTQRSGEH